MHQRRFFSLLLQTICALMACAGLVIFCYFQIDRPVALWVRDHSGIAFDWLAWPDLIKMITIVTPIFLILTGIIRMRRPWRNGEALLVAIAVCIAGMFLLKQILKFVFGRPCTREWIENGGSLEDHDYAFRWFHGFHPYDSFPSGHMAIACMLATLVWILWPKWRWLAVMSIAIIAFCLLITNYHFISDIVAGSVIGWLGGIWSVHLIPPSILPGVKRENSAIRS